MNERELTVDDLSSLYDEGSVMGFAYGGPVGESMQSEIQPAMQYFSEGGEVEDDSPDEEEVEDIGEIPSRPEAPQGFSKGGLAKKAAQLLKELGVAESKVAGKELTTLQDVHTSLGDRIREGAAKMQQQMDAMEFKYGPGQYVFTESSARKNLSPFEIKAKRLYGDQVMREPHPEHPLLGKVIKDPETGRAKRTPYEPGYLVRQKMPEGDWAEFLIPESAIKGTVDGFAKGGAVKKAASALAELVEAPSVALRGKLAEVEKYIAEKYGSAEAKRLQRAADEVKSLEDQYTAEALKEVFRGDNTKPLLVVADPAKFQDFAARLEKPYRPAVERYWREMSAGGGGAEYVPYLNLRKNEGKLPYVSGHEGRHRNIAMAELGYPSTIWQIMTQGDLRGALPRRTREEYLKALFEQIGEKPLVIPESRYTPETKDKLFAEERVRDWKKARTLPEPFSKGGLVHRAQGSPIYGEIADTGPITADTFASFKAKGPSASNVVSESARMLRNIAGEGVSNLESAVRGSVAAIPGAFGDIESIFRESDKTRKLATTEEVLRDYMPKRLTKATKEAKGFEEVGSYLPLPIPAGTVSKAAGATKRGAKKALEELGPVAGGMLETAAARTGAGPMYVVKPKGGTFYPPEIGSGLDTYLDRVVKGLTGAENLAGRDAKAVAEFIRTKGRKYLTSVYGTADDPLRQAVTEGRMPLYGSDLERFRDYLLDAARAGNPNAVKDLEHTYDAATRLGVQGYVPAGSADPSYVLGNRMQAAQRERLLAEGVPEDLINPPYPATSTAEQLAGKSYSDSQKKLGELLQSMEGLPEDVRESFVRGVGNTDKGLQSLLYSAVKEQPIYDIDSTPNIDFLQPTNLARGIASIPVRDLERMTFPEAVVKGSQNMRLKRDRGLVLEKARDGKTVPKEIYFEGTQPVYEIDKNQKWVRIVSPDAVELEGAAMRHSIGGYKTSDNYNLGGRPAFESGLARIFSLRNEKGVPQVTVETKFTDEDGLMIKEIRSKFNSEPTQEEKRAVFQLFDTLGPRNIGSTTYRNTRTGDSLEEGKRVTVNWGDEYSNYLKYKNKGED